MTTANSEVLISDDALYDELYDVRREAEEAGNLIEGDPYPGLSALRDEAPVHKGFVRELLKLPPYQRHEAARKLDGYACFSFDICNQVFRDNVRFSNAIYHIGENPEKTSGILEMDNPEHHAYRKAVQSLFIKPRAQTWWRNQWIDEIVGDLIAGMRGGDRAELNMQLCARVPVHTVTRAVGLRGDDALIFRQALVRGQGSRSGPQAQRQNLITVHRILMEQITKRRAEPGEDILSWLIDNQIEVPGGETRPLTDSEIVTFARLILLAGGGTTWRQMGIVLFALLSDREQLEAVKADPNLIPAAVEESLRWNPTNPIFSRLIAQDTELGGVSLPAGAALEICLGAANRDPARWDNPDVFDLHRPFQQHLGTGIGPHMCLGRSVAATEISVALEALFKEFPNIRFDPDARTPYLTGGLEQRGVSALQVLLD